MMMAAAATTPPKYSMFPIENVDAWHMYKKAVASFWTVEEVDLSTDRSDWNVMTDNERRFIAHVLAFFAVSDGLVMKNLMSRFYVESNDTAVQAFYAFQAAIESIHGEMYSQLIETYIQDSDEKNRLFRATESIATIGDKAAWMERWIESSRASYAERLVAFAAVEGVFFSSSFCAIFWLKRRNKMHGLTFSNELISRDEGLHCDFACLMFRQLTDDRRLTSERVTEIVFEAVRIEHAFVRDALQVNLIGMNADAMCDYVTFVADRLLVALGFERHTTTVNPFDWMEQISLQGKTNFFEKRVGEYQRSGVMTTDRDQLYKFNTEEDF